MESLLWRSHKLCAWPGHRSSFWPPVGVLTWKSLQRAWLSSEVAISLAEQLCFAEEGRASCLLFAPDFRDSSQGRELSLNVIPGSSVCGWAAEQERRMGVSGLLKGTGAGVRGRWVTPFSPCPTLPFSSSSPCPSGHPVWCAEPGIGQGTPWAAVLPLQPPTGAQPALASAPRT